MNLKTYETTQPNYVYRLLQSVTETARTKVFKVIESPLQINGILRASNLKAFYFKTFLGRRKDNRNVVEVIDL